MILNKAVISELLGIATSSGADFAELFAENTLQGNMTLIGGKVEEIADRKISGVGIRLLRGTESVYASTADISYSGLLRCAKQAASAMGELKEGRSVVLTEKQYPKLHTLVSPAFPVPRSPISCIGLTKALPATAKRSRRCVRCSCRGIATS